ncbi:OB-fold nucleic acid binding domain-containing protein [uncultured Jatrophihabitans sp.]|uniref:OB-fold nucleic acid binding domain-containing protein n=1 Tax=uncultured Jatrophihabitans sp. TaxID=1610747 RepID=UPI0035CBEDD6
MGNRPSLLQRLTASAQRLDAVDLQDDVEERCCARMADVRHGKDVEVVGRLRSVVYTPNENVPTLEAELFDGSDTLTLVWLGRRRIAGIEPGRKIAARGRVGLHDGRLAIYNPWYELVSHKA